MKNATADYGDELTRAAIASESTNDGRCRPIKGVSGAELAIRVLWLTAWPSSERRTWPSGRSRSRVRGSRRGSFTAGVRARGRPLRTASGAAGRRLVGYRRRTAEGTVLHELVSRHAQTMFAELRDADPDGNGLPRYVERELAAYLRCGILSHGFVRVRCQACRDEIVVAFSCKSR